MNTNMSMKRSISRWAAVAVLLSLFPASASAASTYKVKSGDTLWGISQKTKLSVQQLMTMNKLSSTVLMVGQTLTLSTNPKTPTQGTSVKTHTVKSGDTLWGISQTYNVSIGDLTKWNPKVTSNLMIGQVLKIVTAPAVPAPTPSKPTPAPVAKVHTVKSGDTLYALSRTYKVSVADLTKWNGLKTSVLMVGQKLKVSTGAATPAPPVPKPTPPAVVVKESIVTASSLYVRSTPSTSGNLVGVLPNGAKVKTGEVKGDWVAVTYGSLKGWSHGDYLSPVGASTPPVAKNGKVIMLDPGHGGRDPGAVRGSAYEKTYTMIYANKTKAQLEKRGYTVYLTRSGDTSCKLPYESTEDLKCRVQKASNLKANIFVSIHMNAADNAGVQGTETYYNASRYTDNRMNPYPAQSIKLANAIHAKYQPAFGSGNKFIQDRNWYVNRWADMPSVLLEVGYLSSPRDLARIQNSATQDRVAAAIASGIDAYFN